MTSLSFENKITASLFEWFKIKLSVEYYLNSGEMAQWLYHLPHKLEDLNLNPQNLHDARLSGTHL